MSFYFHVSVQMEVHTTPGGAHRVLSPLNWSRRPTDGDIMRAQAADGSRGLRGQPRQSRHQGVSFFVPSSAEAAEVAHAAIGRPVHGCAVTVPGLALPANLRFINDRLLRLPVLNAATGQTEMIECGQHFTLFTSCDTSTTAFEDAYAQIMSTCLPCQLSAHAAPALDVDWDYLPGDRMTMAAVLALDELATSSEDPNTRMFSALYSLHLRANDMAFAEVLDFGPAAEMVAAALDSWTVTDPLLAADVHQGRELLSETLGYEFEALKYEPYWVSEHS